MTVLGNASSVGPASLLPLRNRPHHFRLDRQAVDIIWHRALGDIFAQVDLQPVACADAGDADADDGELGEQAGGLGLGGAGGFEGDWNVVRSAIVRLWRRWVRAPLRRLRVAAKLGYPRITPSVSCT